MRFGLVRILASLVCLCASAEATTLADKALHGELDELVQQALQGQTLDLLVEVDTGDTESIYAKLRSDSYHSFQVRLALVHEPAGRAQIETTMRAEDGRLLGELRGALASAKNIARTLLTPDVSVMDDEFPHLPIMRVHVRGADALDTLFRNPHVKYVNRVRRIKPTADWPNSYGDLTLIGGSSYAGVDGIKGKNTRIVVLDTAAYLGALPGWNGDYGCFPYDGVTSPDTHMDPSTLASAGRAISANCRVWNAINFTKSDTSDYCAGPYYSDGSQFAPCYGSGWKHGTLVSQVAMRTAPGAYVTALQVYDSRGNGNSVYVQKALDWTIQNAMATPRIAAINISFAESENTKYTTYCSSSVYTNRVATLRSYGIATIVASGNKGWTDGVNMPACVTGVLSVGATTDSTVQFRQYAACSDPTLAVDQVPCFSNTHPALVNVFAPGVDIGSGQPLEMSDPGFSILKASGTSVAAPHVAGEVAILRGENGFGLSVPVQQIIDTVIQNGRSVTDRRRTSIVKQRINIRQALAAPASVTVTPRNAVVKMTGMIPCVGLTASVFDRTGNLHPDQSATYTTTTPDIISVSQSDAKSAMVCAKSLGSGSVNARAGGAVGTASVVVLSR